MCGNHDQHLQRLPTVPKQSITRGLLIITNVNHVSEIIFVGSTGWFFDWFCPKSVGDGKIPTKKGKFELKNL